jgi:putative redox protein
MTTTPESPQQETIVITDPHAPQLTTVHQLVGKRFLGVTPDGMRVPIDGESHARTGMRPMQLLLNALGACAAYDIVAMIGKRRLEILGYRIELEGTRSTGAPAWFTHVHARHYLQVPGLDERTAARFVELGMTKYCSGAASLKAEISFEVILEEAGEADGS